MTKIRVYITMVLCLLSLFVASIASAESEDHAKEMVAAVQQKMALINSYHANLAVSMSMTIQGKSIQSTTNGDMDIFIKPILAKSNMDILVSAGGNDMHLTLQQYMEQSGNQLILYIYDGGKWHKQSVPIGTFSQTPDYENYLKQIKSASITSENQDTAVLNAVMDGKYLKETLQKNTGALGLAQLNLTDDLISSIGDIAYTIVIDKNTMTFSSMDMDMSDFMQRFGVKLIERTPIPDEKKGPLKEMFSNMQMHIHMNMTRYNEIEPFTIPDEAKAALPEKPKAL